MERLTLQVRTCGAKLRDRVIQILSDNDSLANNIRELVRAVCFAINRFVSFKKCTRSCLFLRETTINDGKLEFPTCKISLVHVESRKKMQRNAKFPTIFRVIVGF